MNNEPFRAQGPGCSCRKTEELNMRVVVWNVTVIQREGGPKGSSDKKRRKTTSSEERNNSILISAVLRCCGCLSMVISK